MDDNGLQHGARFCSMELGPFSFRERVSFLNTQQPKKELYIIYHPSIIYLSRVNDIFFS